MNRVLVTGASGFLGRPALAALGASGYEIHAAVRHVPQRKSDGVSWHAVDLLDAEARRDLLHRSRPTHLLHLAWFVEHGTFWTAAENGAWRSASLDLAREFARQGGRRAVMVGSCAEYDWSRRDAKPWAESDPLRPATPYGKAKHELLQALAREAPNLGLSYAWARLFLMFGDGENEKRLVPSLIEGLLAGREVALGTGERVRDFMDVKDIAAAIAALLVRETVTGAVNVASGAGVTIAELAERIADLADAPRSLLRFNALPPRDEPPAMVADVRRLRDEVKFVPRFSLEQRLKEQVARRRVRR